MGFFVVVTQSEYSLWEMTGCIENMLLKKRLFSQSANFTVKLVKCQDFID